MFEKKLYRMVVPGEVKIKIKIIGEYKAKVLKFSATWRSRPSTVQCRRPSECTIMYSNAFLSIISNGGKRRIIFHNL